MAGLEGENSRQFPIRKELPSKRPMVSWPGQFIHSTQYKPVRPNKCIRAIVRPWIVVVAIHLAPIWADRAFKNVGQVPSKRVRGQELQSMAEALRQAGLQSVVPGNSVGPNVEHASC